VATLVARGVPPEVVFTTVTHEIGRVLGADATVMLRLDADGGTTVMGETGHHPDEMPVGSRWELDPQLATAQVLRTGRSARRDDYRGVPGAFADVIRRKQIRSSVAIPIMVEGRIWGALGAGNTRERFPADTERRMAGFTDLIGTAIVNAESRAEITRLLEVQASLRQVATLVAREVPPEEIIPTVAEEIGRLVDADALLMARLDPDGVCTIVAQSGPHPPVLHVGQRWELDPDLAMAEVLRTAQPAYRDSYPRLSNPSADYIELMGIRSSVAIPITVEGRIWGALAVGVPVWAGLGDCGLSDGDGDSGTVPVGVWVTRGSPSSWQLGRMTAPRAPVRRPSTERREKRRDVIN
jgi:GAF domain-containing protein